MTFSTIQNSATQTAPSPLRWRVAGLLCVASALNYLDRQTLSVLATTIQAELRLSDVDYSMITAAFLTSYTAMYLVSGALTDRLGPKLTLSISVLGWSVANALHAFARTAGALAGARFGLGVFESAHFPAGIKAVALWFPVRERALAVGVFNAGASLGAALAVPLVSAVALQFGWRWAFSITGGLGLLWLVGWWLTPGKPGNWSDHESAAASEPSEAGVFSLEKPRSVGRDLGELLRLPKTYAVLAARVLIDPVTYFLIFWIPKYLQQQQGFDLKTLGAAAWIPYVALSVGQLVGGWLPNRLVQSGHSLDFSRKSVMLASSLLIPACYAGLYLAHAPALALALVAGVMFGHGAWGNLTVSTELFPARVQGLLTGLGGTLGGLAGIATQAAIGYTVQNVSYAPVFVFAGTTYLVALALVQRLGGRLGENA